jgi:phosphotriesterase-related protein
MSHDIALKHWLSKYGGWGIHHIPRTVVPLMRRKGMSQALIEKILIENPARVLSIDPRSHTTD